MNARFSPLCLLLLLQSDAVSPAKEPGAPEVLVSRPVRRDVTDYVNFPARTESVIRVELRARVSGYLMKVSFKEGSEVKQGDLLFEIDPRPYQAELDKAQANVVLNQARVKRLVNERPSPKMNAELEEAQAAVRIAHAGLEAARLNLAFTHVTAPCDGVIGRSLLSPGSLVKADTTVLGQIVTMDPMYVYFDMDEATLLRLRHMINESKAKPMHDTKAPVSMALAGEEGFPHQGLINFLSNEFNALTGTITVRAVFPNPRPANGVQLMTPGMFARIRLPVGEPHAALLVPEAAHGTTGSQTFLYVVDPNNKVQRRSLKLGQLQENGLREILNGIGAEDRIIMEGANKLKPGMVVRPKTAAVPR